MKTKMLGIFMILVGAVIIASGITVMSGAAGNDSAQTVHAVQNAELKTGKYYLNANPERDCIEIFEDGTFMMTGFERQEYRFREWSDIAVTDEASGKITLTDLYFLGTNLDGGKNFTEKIRFDPENDTLEYDGHYYFYAA